jgi:hypothetical protein
MPTTHVHAETSLSAERFRAALTNFTDLTQRLTDFSTLSADVLKVHEVGDTFAIVTEGASIAGGVWEKLRYDWSDPNIVMLTTIDGNVFMPGGSWCYTTSSTADGKTRVDLTVRHTPKTIKGKFFAVILTLAGAPFLTADLKKTLRRLEARYS